MGRPSARSQTERTQEDGQEAPPFPVSARTISSGIDANPSKNIFDVARVMSFGSPERGRIRITQTFRGTTLATLALRRGDLSNA